MVEKRQVEAGKLSKKREGISAENTPECTVQHLNGSHLLMDQLYLPDTQKKFQKSWLSN